MRYNHLKEYSRFKTKYNCFDYQLINKILFIVLNREKPANTMSYLFFSEIYHVFKTVNYCELDIRCVVLKSKYQNFSTGLDMKDTGSDLFQTMKSEGDIARKTLVFENIIKQMQKAFTRIEKCRVPVIAQVRGYCIGGAIDMISACDMVYSDSSSHFSIREVKIGMAADLGTLNRLSLSSKNQGLLRQLAYTGRFFSSQEAYDLGLVTKILKTTKLEKFVNDLSKEIAANSPVAVMVTKRGLVFMKRKMIKEGLDFMKNQNHVYASTDDVFEAVASIFSKNIPTYPKL